MSHIFSGAGNNSWADVQINWSNGPKFSFRMMINSYEITQDYMDISSGYGGWKEYAPGSREIILRGYPTDEGFAIDAEMAKEEKKPKPKVKPEKAPAHHHVKPKKTVTLEEGIMYRLPTHKEKPEDDITGGYYIPSYQEETTDHVRKTVQEVADKILNDVKNRKPLTINELRKQIGYKPLCQGEEGPELVIPMGYWGKLPKYPSYEENKKALEKYYKKNGPPLSDSIELIKHLYPRGHGNSP